MKKLLVDTNVVLDVLLNRQPHAEGSSALWAAVETGTAIGFLAAHAVTTIHYLIQKDLGAAQAKRTVSSILRVFAVASVGGFVISDALQLGWADFEDAVTASAAGAAGCDYIVTRDPKEFRGGVIPIVTPEAVVPLIGITGS